MPSSKTSYLDLEGGDGRAELALRKLSATQTHERRHFVVRRYQDRGSIGLVVDPQLVLAA